MKKLLLYSVYRRHTAVIHDLFAFLCTKPGTHDVRLPETPHQLHKIDGFLAVTHLSARALHLTGDINKVHLCLKPRNKSITFSVPESTMKDTKHFLKRKRNTIKTASCGISVLSVSIPPSEQCNWGISHTHKDISPIISKPTG